jgi:hypothetical protein
VDRSWAVRVCVIGDLWEDEGFGGAGTVSDADGDDDWDEGDESLDVRLEDGFDDPDEPEGGGEE